MSVRAVAPGARTDEGQEGKPPLARGSDAPCFEGWEMATLLDTPARRIERWVERGLLKPQRSGRGQGRRRAFSIHNLVQGALLAELQRTFGERNPYLKTYLAIASMFVYDLSAYLLSGDMVRELTFGIATRGDHNVSFTYGIAPFGENTTPQIVEWIDQQLRQGGTVSVFYLRPRMEVIRQRLLKLERGGELPSWTKLAVHARPSRDDGVGPRPIAQSP
jgi:hypothetical protein